MRDRADSHEGWPDEHVLAVKDFLDNFDDEAYEHADNFRYARVGNREEEDLYEKAARQGCCGSDDATVTARDGQVIRIGWNFGH